jgi:hypothetical protein
MAATAELIARANPDIVNLVEIENVAAPTIFNGQFLAAHRTSGALAAPESPWWVTP